jgi:glycosyltransferase involved in cell wall biosynthesis
MTASLRARDPLETKRRHLLHVFPTFAVGGSQSRFAQLLAIWEERYRHSIVSLDGTLAMAEKLPNWPAITYVPLANPARSTLGGLTQALEIIDINRPSVLVTYNWGSFNWWLAKRLRPRLRHIHIEDGFGPEEQKRLLTRRNLARRLILNDRSTEVVLPSQTLYHIALQSWALSPKHLHYIPNGIEWRRFAAERQHRPSDRPITVGTIATLRREKNIPRLISIFNQAVSLRPSLPIMLRIVGGGDQIAEIQKHAMQSPYRDQIMLTGPTSTPQDHLREIDIFAITSDTEQMPLSVLEAMAASLPVISFDVGDIASMVSPENRPAASIDRTDDRSFVNLLLELVNDQEKRLMLGQSNLAAVRNRFDANQMANSYAALLD